MANTADMNQVQRKSCPIFYISVYDISSGTKQTGVNKSNRKNAIEDFREFGFWIFFLV